MQQTSAAVGCAFDRLSTPLLLTIANTYYIGMYSSAPPCGSLLHAMHANTDLGQELGYASFLLRTFVIRGNHSRTMADVLVTGGLRQPTPLLNAS